MSENQEPEQSKVVTPDSLINFYKKKGYLDQRRKALLEEFKQTEACEALNTQVEKIIFQILEQNPELYKKNVNQLPALIHGALKRQTQVASTTFVRKEELNLEGIEDISEIYKAQVDAMTVESEELQDELVLKLKDIGKTLEEEELKRQADTQKEKEKEAAARDISSSQFGSS